MKVNRGQAAMEFLMTYGWAILVVLVAIGALAYFGVLSPARFLPSSCQLQSGVSCDSYKVATNGIRIVLRNGLGQDMRNVVIGVNECGTMASSVNVTDGSTTNQVITCTLTAGSRFKETVWAYYTDPNGVTHNNTGQIVSTVEAGTA